MKDWLKTRTVQVAYATALLLSTFVLILSVFGPIDSDSMMALMVTHIPIEDVLVNAIGGFLGGAALLWLAIGTRGLKSLRTKFSRPSVRLELGRAPENIFSGIELGAPVQLIEQKLGPPTRRYRDWWGYRFSDALVALTFDDEGSLSSIAVALTDPNTIFEFPAWQFDCPPLGKITLKELLVADHLKLSFEESLRHRELRVTGQEGPAGVWHGVSFGALSPNIPGSLLAAEFEWDREISALVSLPQDVRVNWAAVHSGADFDGFPWDFAITI
ncbi:hypothetical protein BSY239_2907 [Hydrogenophaga sp. RAC07]|jgi:hypothetical protein|uniref:hypothetical protein n=1 Tax=Hydrogenophaga sp. RAC07 TaxID=1842537 RepID=UPI0008575C24|nr:hypothetical protein [Hydrogenophaga sp. RAC07]AOF86131.1 hypothetical protein BSY239_2907 [Hydrogenophaga sp. RAC07]